MATVGSLAINVLARTKNFTKGMTRVSNRLKSTSKLTSALNAKMLVMAKGFIAAAVATVTVGAAVKKLKQSFTDLEATGRLGAQIGMSTKTLMALQFAAESTGSSVGAMNQTLLRASRRVGLFSEGSGAAARALKEAGFAANAFQGLNLEQSFKLIADEIASHTDIQMQNARAFEILGDSAQALLPILRQGGAGIDELVRQAETMGVTMDEAMIQKVIDANQAMTELSAVMTTLSNDIAVSIAPEVQAFVRDLTDLVAACRELAAWLDKIGLSPVFQAMGKMNIVSEGAEIARFLGFAQGNPSGNSPEAIERRQLEAAENQLDETRLLRRDISTLRPLEVTI